MNRNQLSTFDATMTAAYLTAEQLALQHRPPITTREQRIDKSLANFATIAVGDLHGSRHPAPSIVNRDTYVDNYRGSVFIAIGAIARKCAMQPVSVFRTIKKKSGSRHEPVKPTHPLVELFENVNPIDTAYDLWFYQIFWRMLTGNSYTWKAKNGFGTPKQLWPMPSQWVEAVPSDDQFIGSYRIRSGVFGSDEVYLPASEIIDIKEPNPDWKGAGRFYGYPTIKAAATSIDLENEMFTRLYYQFKNFAPPGMVFSTDKRLNAPQLRQVYQQLANQHSAADKTGRPIVSHSGLTLQGEFNRGVRELDFQQSLMGTLEYTLSIHGVPKAIVGLVRDTNRANMESAMVAFCLDEKTECLTDKGWMNHKDLTFETKVACFDPERNKIIYRNPSRVFRARYEGAMHRWKARGLDGLMTPEHRTYVQTFEKPGQQRREFKVRKAGDLARTTFYRIRTAAQAACAAPSPIRLDSARKRRGTKERWIDSDLWLEFLGYYVSEGCVTTPKHRVVITQAVDSPYRATIQKCLDKTPFKWRKTFNANCIQWVANDKALADYLKRHCGASALVKRLPDYVKSWPADSLRTLLESAIIGDGCDWKHHDSTDESSVTYYTSSPQLADDIQEVSVKCGLRSSLSEREPDSDPSDGIQRAKRFWVNICTRDTFVVQGQHRTVEEYNGDIWCVTVPTGLFFVRRNGCVHVTGNCENTINPLLKHHSEHLTQDLAFEFDPDLVVRLGPCTVEDRESMRKAIETASKTGAVTPNEVREVLMSMKPFETGGHRPLVNAGMTQAPFGEVDQAELDAEQAEQEAKEMARMAAKQPQPQPATNGAEAGAESGSDETPDMPSSSSRRNGQSGRAATNGASRRRKSLDRLTVNRLRKAADDIYRVKKNGRASRVMHKTT